MPAQYVETLGNHPWQEILQRAGATGNALFGIQFDLNAAWRKSEGEVVAASFCDHNCTTEHGGYNCLAAASLNVGIQPKSVAPASDVIQAVTGIAEGTRTAQASFFGSGFGDYRAAFDVPDDVAAAMQTLLDTSNVEVNLFGGNPELHPEVTQIIAALRGQGHTVHLTTTGGRFMRDKKFVDEIIANPPSLLALSADDFESADDIRWLASLPLEDLKAAWKQVPRGHGQRRKAIEAIYAARLAQEIDGFPPILFNMVLHDGNLPHANEMIATLAEAFPGAKINPFPAQNAFYYGEGPAIALQNGKILCDFIDGVINAHVQALQSGGEIPYTPRLHYWLMLRAAFDYAGDNTAQALQLISGNGIWQCYRSEPAGFYLQAGLGPEGDQQQEPMQLPGGHLGCFWNRQTVTSGEQIWGRRDLPVTTNHYIHAGKAALAAQSERPCPGCAFPRLTGSIIATESGMDPRLHPYYLARRKASFGY